MDEANVPTQCAQAGQDARVPEADVDTGRAGRAARPPGQGPASALGLIPPDTRLGRPPGPVRGRRAFEDLRRSGRTGRSGPISVTYLEPQTTSGPQMAFAIRRTAGTAVERNRLRRRLRAIATATPLRPGTYLVRPTDRAIRMNFSQLTGPFCEAVARATGGA